MTGLDNKCWQILATFIREHWSHAVCLCSGTKSHPTTQVALPAVAFVIWAQNEMIGK